MLLSILRDDCAFQSVRPDPSAFDPSVIREPFAPMIELIDAGPREELAPICD